jgi:hypothetical protein
VYCGHYWPIVPAPNDRCGWLWRNWWNEDWQGKPKYLEKTVPQRHFVHHKSHMTLRYYTSDTVEIITSTDFVKAEPARRHIQWYIRTVVWRWTHNFQASIAEKLGFSHTFNACIRSGILSVCLPRSRSLSMLRYWKFTSVVHRDNQCRDVDAAKHRTRSLCYVIFISSHVGFTVSKNVWIRTHVTICMRSLSL